MKKILVPTDFSTEAGFALDLACQLAAKDHAKVLLFNILEYPAGSSINTMGISHPDPMQEVFLVKLVETSKRHLKELTEVHADKGVEIETKIAWGSPYVGIANAVAEEEADLLVMGTTGSSGLEEALLGSNTEKVVRRATCPVIAVKNAVDASQIKTIMVPTNLRDELGNFFGQLKELQQVLGATVRVVRINTPSFFMKDTDAYERLEGLANKYQLDGYVLDTFNDVTEEEGIINYAVQEKAQLIAMPTHGRRGIMHLIAGSIAEDLVNHAHVPVFTFKIG